MVQTVYFGCLLLSISVRTRVAGQVLLWLGPAPAGGFASKAAGSSTQWDL
jgi:hypothetical protein